MSTRIDPFRAAMGKRIAKARKQKGLSQIELAAKVGVTHSAVGQWETGRTSPDMQAIGENLSVFDRVVEVLGITREFLLTGDQRKEKDRAQTDVEREYLKILRLMTTRQKAKHLISMYEELGVGPASNLIKFNDEDDVETPPAAPKKPRKPPTPGKPRMTTSTRGLQIAC